MELELGLKVTRNADDFSSTEFQFAKDRTGPVFQSTETEIMFILTAHLKGYMQKNIKIDINEEGEIIAIMGEKRVQETVMVGWKLVKKDVEIKKFRKAFKIPDGVILEKIKARFDDDKSTLTIKMPKKVKGILGIVIEPLKENDELTKQTSSEDNKVPKSVTFKEDMDKPPSSSIDSESTYKKVEDNQEKKKEIVPKTLEEKVLQDQEPHEEVKKHVVKDKVNNPLMEKQMPKVESNSDMVQEIRETQSKQSASSRDELKNDEASETANGMLEEEESGEISSRKEDENVPRRGSKICVPIVAAGSALILSFVVFVIHLIRTKNPSGKRRD